MEKSLSLKEFENKDIIISSQFKPSIRQSSKIIFTPDLSSSLKDSVPQMDFDYAFRVSPFMIEHHSKAAGAENIGFETNLLAKKHTQYVKLGYGLHQRLDGAFHIQVLPHVKTIGLHLMGSYNQLKPDHTVYQYNYDFQVGALARIFFADKYELSFQYALDGMEVKSNYAPTNTQQSLSIPSLHHRMKLGFNNLKHIETSKWFISPSVEANFFEQHFSSLQHKQFDSNFSLYLPAVILLGQKMRLNIFGGYDYNVFHSKKTETSTPVFRTENYILRGSTNLQYIRENVNAYLGFILFNSSSTSFAIYPDFFAHIGFGNASPFFIQAKFTAKQYYQDLYSFRSINPWIRSDSAFGNVNQIYAQVAAQYNVKERFNVRLSLEWSLYNNLRLINNDFSNNYQTFELLNEKSLGELVLRNDYAYIQPNQYEIGLTLIRTFMTNQEVYAKPIGRFYPLLEVFGMYQLFPFLKARVSFLVYDNVLYFEKPKSLIKETANAPLILNLFLEASLLKRKQLKIWLDLNNILSQQFERWYSYKHPGFVGTLGVSFYW